MSFIENKKYFAYVILLKELSSGILIKLNFHKGHKNNWFSVSVWHIVIDLIKEGGVEAWYKLFICEGVKSIYICEGIKSYSQIVRK